MQNGIPFSIIVVDDDEEDRQVIDEAFQAIGYETEVKKLIDGRELLRYLEEAEPALHPSLIVLDNTLPQMNAADLLATLKSNPSWQDIRVVVYSTLLTPAKKEQLLAAGAYACFEKCSTMQQVIAIASELKKLAQEGKAGS